MDADLVYGIIYTLVVIGVCGTWFHRCGHADRNRRARAFAKRTFRYVGPGLVLGIAFLTSNFGSPPVGLIAFTTCCGLLAYAAGWALVVADDDSLVVVNLTGRALLLTDPRLAHLFALPAPQDHSSTELPPAFPRTCYVVNPVLGRLGARAGRTDMFLVELSSAKDMGAAGLLVRRLIQLAPEERQ